MSIQAHIIYLVNNLKQWYYVYFLAKHTHLQLASTEDLFLNNALNNGQKSLFAEYYDVKSEVDL